MQGQFLIILTIVIVVAIVIFVTLYLIKKMKVRIYKNRIKDLEMKRNQVASTPVLLELSKVEPIIKNDKMEEKYSEWQDRFNYIKEKRLTHIDDMLIDLDSYFEKKDYKSLLDTIADIEIEIYKTREAAEHLLEQIKDITLSEEKYRSIITKLKTKYRTLNREFHDHKELYGFMCESIEMQLENIEKRFFDFEKVMEKNDYNEVVHICKALDNMIEHMDILIKELPDVLLMSQTVIPNRMKEVESTYKEMVDAGYVLDYLNIEYNINESKKNIERILDKVKMINLEGCMFDLKTMLEYYDSLFIDFEKERLSRKLYEEVSGDFYKRLEKTNKLVEDVYSQLDDIKNMYDLSDDDINVIHEVNKVLVVINDDYRKMVQKDETKSCPYSMLSEEVENLTNRLIEMEGEFDKALKSLGNMYDDELRAREQLEEIKNILSDCKNRIRSFELPVVVNNYYVQLDEANEAISYVVTELERKPIEIKVLNTRVDTARDLVLKLYNTTNEMIKNAYLSEAVIVFANRYRSTNSELDSNLAVAEEKFYNGYYRDSLEISVRALSSVDENIIRKLMVLYEK